MSETMIDAPTEDGYMTLTEASKYVQYNDPSSLRQAIRRGSMKGELRRSGPFTYYVTRKEWVDEYIRNRRTRNRDHRVELIGSDPE